MATAAEFIAEAEKFLGVPYVYGGESPSGFDCSGLVQYCLNAIGVPGCPRTSEEQWAWCKHVSYGELAPGDLIFEEWPGDSSPPGHVIIYIGGDRVVEAPETGQVVHVRNWSPAETIIVGYGQVPGLDLGGPSPVPGARTVRSSAQVAPVLTWGENSLHAFAVAAGGAVEYRAWNGSSWNPWVNLGGAVNSAYPMPVPVSWAPDRIDVFTVGTAGNVMQRSWVGDAWAPARDWNNLGNSGFPPSSPAVAVSQAENSLDVFYNGQHNNTIWRRSWTGESWTGWTDLGSIPSKPGSVPAVCTWGQGRLDVCVVGAGNTVMHSGWGGGAWAGGWQDVGGNPAHDPALVSWGQNRLDLFIVGTDGNLWHNSWNGQWLGWQNMGNGGYAFNSAPFAVCQAENSIDVFVMGPHYNTIWRQSWDGRSWSGWTDLGAVNSAPSAKAAVAAWGPGRLDAFTLVTPNNVYHSGWGGGPWEGSWENLAGDVRFF